MEFVRNFFVLYGFSFLMMVIIGAVIALLLEITVKKAFAWLEAKLGEKGQKVLSAVKIAMIQVLTWTLVIFSTHLVVESMPLPGSKVFSFFWAAFIYIVQYIFSCWGIKGIQSFIAKKNARAEARRDAKAKAEANRPVLNKVLGTDNLYTDEEGRYCDSKGRRL